MTDRLTKDWVENSEQAFGESGKIGDEGEARLVTILRHIGVSVEHYTENKFMQCSGIDIEGKWDGHQVTIDAKTNLKYDQYRMKDFVFYVECDPDGWLFNKRKKSTMFIHFCLDNELMVIYGRKEMQQYAMKHRDKWREFNGNNLLKMNVMSVPDFVMVSTKDTRDAKFGTI